MTIKHPNNKKIYSRRKKYLMVIYAIFATLFIVFLFMSVGKLKIEEEELPLEDHGVQIMIDGLENTSLNDKNDVNIVNVSTPAIGLYKERDEKVLQQTDVVENPKLSPQDKMFIILVNYGVSEMNAKQIVKATFEELTLLERYGFTYMDVLALIYAESSFKNHKPYWDNGGYATGYFSLHDSALYRVKQDYKDEFKQFKHASELLNSPYYQTKVALRYLYILSNIAKKNGYSDVKYVALSYYNGRTKDVYDNAYIRLFKNRYSKIRKDVSLLNG